MSDRRLYQKVAKQILEMIDSGTYPPGTRLPGERELAEQFGVSRVVIREAEISLEALGRVDIRVGSGVYVCSPDAAKGIILPSVSAFELTQTRLLFESECAALAATVITDKQLDELEDAIARMSDGSKADGDRADYDFHLLIAKATGNSANVFFMENLWRMRTEIDAVKNVYAAVCKDDSSHRVEEHADIVESLRRRNPDASRNAMRLHFSRLFEALLEACEQQDILEARRKSALNRERYLKSTINP